MSELRLTVFSPATALGGTNLLMVRLCAELIGRHAVSVTIVDFPEGKTVEALRSRSVPFQHIEYSSGTRCHLGETDIVLTNLLSAKLLGSQVLPRSGSRLMLWSTFPFDGFKYLPISNLFNGSAIRTRALAARLIHPSYSGRLGRFLTEAANRSSLVFMDQENRTANERIFGVNLRENILPLITAEPSRVWVAPTKPTRICWLGRLTDFKYRPVCALIRAMAHNLPSFPELTLDVIGDGAESGLVMKYARQYPMLPVRFLGQVPPQNLDEVLTTRADLVAGHGTSILEAAKLGIPSMVVNGFYMTPGSGELRGTWLQDMPAGSTGRLVDSWGETGTAPLAVLLGTWQHAAEALGREAEGQWRRNHAPGIVAQSFMDFADKCSLDIDLWTSLGVRRLDPHGRLIEWVKRRIFKRIY